MNMRIVVIGGRGNFGARICRALARENNVNVISIGRRNVAVSSPGILQAQLDITAANFELALAHLAPNLVIHCAGPFQGQDYVVARAAVNVGAHYIDLADGRDYVANFSQHLDALAHERKVLAISGASSVPALSSAVVDVLGAKLAAIKSIHIVIAPAQRSPRGAATLAGVFSYAGRPFRMWRDGRWETVYGWQEVKQFAFPGLGTRTSALCDIPDLELFPARYAGVQTVEFRAALELKMQHSALNLAAGLRRIGLPLPIENLAGPLDRFARLFDGLGSERGGMLVRVEGTTSDGEDTVLDWHVLANNNHGPEIPCMAAILLARKLATGQLQQHGAHACMGFLDLSAFQPEFEYWGMTTNLTTNIMEHRK